MVEGSLAFETYFGVGDVVWEVHVYDGEAFLDGPITVPSKGIVLAEVSAPRLWPDDVVQLAYQLSVS